MNSILRYKKITADLCTCKYCGRDLITIDDIGQCDRGCSGNMRMTGCSAEIYIDLKNGETHFDISAEQSEEMLC